MDRTELNPRPTPTIDPATRTVPLDRVEEFVSLLGLHQRRIHRFVASLILRSNDADDVIQETQLVLWREFGTYQTGTNFAAWACSVAFHQVLAWRKRQQRDRLVLSESVLTTLSQELIDDADRFDERERILAGCLEKLPAHHRELLTQRYLESGSVESIARQTQRSIESVYRMLSRIRRTLSDCVRETQLAGSGLVTQGLSIR